MALTAITWALTASIGVAAAQESADSLGFNEGFDGDWKGRWSTRRLAARVGTYAVVDSMGNAVLSARSQSAASAMVRRLSVASPDVGRISWRWLVPATLSGARSERTKGGDDFVARVFVIFEGEFGSRRTRAVCYVWAAAEPVGSTFPNAYSDRVAMIVLQSGNSRAGSWIREERDFLEDYRAFFGEAPGSVTGTALMVDTDNTRSSAIAFFDDLTVAFR
jgi:hypothetical protein